MTLIARWSAAEDPLFDPPEVFWDDGRPATYQDYLDHMGDTHELVICADGSLERRMYPWILADVRYDGYIQMWFMVAPGQEPLSLDLKDINATDEQIISVLYEFPKVYKARIRR